MTELNPHLLESKGIVFVSPIYYYDVTAQIKAVIDRFYANDAALHNGKKTALLVTMADNSKSTAAGAAASFEGTAKYLGWDVAGTVIGVDCADVQLLEKTDYPRQAYELGKNF